MRKIPFWLLVLTALVGVYFWESFKRDDRTVASVKPAPTNTGVIEAPPVMKPVTDAAAKVEPQLRAPASKDLLADILPPSLRGRARFENVDGGFLNRRHVRVRIDEAEVIGANITVNEAGDKVVKTHLPEMPSQLAKFPPTETDRLKEKIETEVSKVGNLETIDTVLIRKMWLPVKSEKKLQAAVEFLVKSRNKDTSQITEEVFQFDPESGELLTRYEPTKR